MDPFDARQAAAVWNRVTGASAQTEPADEQGELTGLICDALTGRDTYLALARRVRGDGVQTLRQLAREKAAHAKKLTAFCFVQTGSRTEAKAAPAATDGTLLEALGACCRRTQAAAAQYRRLAESKPNGRALFEQLASDEERHGSVLLALLEARL